MVCPMCPAAGFIGGSIGGYFGISAPKSAKGQAVHMLATASLTAATVIALKFFFNFSICGGEGYTLKAFSKVIAKTTLFGLIYAIGISALFTHFFDSKEMKDKPKHASSCCSCKEN